MRTSALSHHKTSQALSLKATEARALNGNKMSDWYAKIQPCKWTNADIAKT